MTNPPDQPVEESGGAVLVRVFVAPRSSATKIVGIHNGAVKVALTAPPVEGAANKALVEFIAKQLGVPRSSVEIISGEASRRKTLRVSGLQAEIVREKLGIHMP